MSILIGGLQFEHVADVKINACVADSTQKHEPDLDRLFGHGHDANLDRIINALAHFSRFRSKTIVERTVLWYQKHRQESLRVS